MRIKLLFVLAALLAATGCAPYKMDIRQGNYLTPEQRERLKVGMTRTQVRALLGTPLVADPFHPERWDYVYTYEHRKERLLSERMTLYFEGEKLARIDNANMPPLPSPAQAGGEGSKP